MLKRNQILAKSKPKNLGGWSGSANIPDENPDENTGSQDGGRRISTGMWYAKGESDEKYF